MKLTMGGKMKVSNYNFMFPYKNESGKYIAYNSLSNSLALIDEDKYNKFVNFEKNNIALDDEQFENDLRRGAFILDDNLNELEVIRYKMNSERYGTDSLTLTIAPTSDCNFRCVYCFEKEAITPTYMTAETEESIIKYVESKIKNINRLSITWYGGEPLLAVGTIDRLSKKFIQLCNDNNVNYSANIATNGYNLSKKNLDMLRNYNVINFQITVDGNAKTHDSRRPLVGSLPTFDKIISNLEKLKDEEIVMALRINIDKTNYQDAIELLDIIVEKDIKHIVFPYIAKVEPTNDCYDGDVCLSVEKFNELRLDFVKEMEKRNFKISNQHNYPYRINSVCGCDRVNSLVINADGEIYKCWNDLGKKEISIGNINDMDKTSINKSYMDYIIYDPTHDEECKECKFLPSCMGGCPFNRLFNPSVKCRHNTKMLMAYLEKVTEKMLKEVESAC